MARLIATCMVSNEADIIEAFVRHNLQFLDALVVLDHASVDATPEILRSLHAEGLPLVLLHDPDRAFNQGMRQTQMAKQFFPQMNADFCFAMDADEFLKVPTRPALEDALGRLPAQCHGLVSMQNYFGSSGQDRNPLRTLTRRLASERQRSHKVVLRRGFERDASAQVALGNHAAVHVVGGKVQPLPHAPLEGVALAHLPVRSADQVAKKALLGWLSHRLTRPERFLGEQADGPNVPASHWRVLFRQLAEGRIEPSDELVRAATAAYAGGAAPVTEGELVDDPIGCNFELRYTPDRAASSLATLASWADKLVSDVNAERSAGSSANSGDWSDREQRQA